MIWRLRGCYSGAHNKKLAISIYLSLLCYNLIKIYMEITAIMRYRRYYHHEIAEIAIALCVRANDKRKVVKSFLRISDPFRL